MSTSEPIILPSRRQWDKIGKSPHQGINLPLFSIRSEASNGIGEFYDLFPLISWCKELGMDVVQLLPLNDTGYGTSPYSAISAFALNPIHLSLSQLPEIEAHNALLKEGRELNSSNRVQVEKVRSFKDRFLRNYYSTVSKTIKESELFQHFLEKNQSWLEGYALFKILLRAHKGFSWENWQPEFKNLRAGTEQVRQLVEQNKEEIHYHSFIQFLCFTQLSEVKKHASNNQVWIKGDIPILIDRNSADVWLNRQLFEMQYSAGAPADMYNEEGQKWGFPVYDWSHGQSVYDWWSARLQYAENFYDIYRLDHIVGFYRIWAIPLELKATEGKFIPDNQENWLSLGEKNMRHMLEQSSMLPIGEDLGTVPSEVRKNLQDLGICGTKVMRWERNWNGDQSYISVYDYPPTSMTTVSTHDSETVSLWWKNQPKEAEAYAQFKGWRYTPELTKEMHISILYDSHHSTSLFHINLLNEYLALVDGLTSPSLEDERINIPGIVNDYNWTYRFIPTVKEIVSNRQLKEVMHQVLGT